MPKVKVALELGKEAEGRRGEAQLTLDTQERAQGAEDRSELSSVGTLDVRSLSHVGLRTDCY